MIDFHPIFIVEYSSFSQIHFKNFSPIPLKLLPLDTPCHFPFIWAIFLALNLSISRVIGRNHTNIALIKVEFIFIIIIPSLVNYENSHFIFPKIMSIRSKPGLSMFNFFYLNNIFSIYVQYQIGILLLRQQNFTRGNIFGSVSSIGCLVALTTKPSSIICRKRLINKIACTLLHYQSHTYKFKKKLFNCNPFKVQLY